MPLRTYSSGMALRLAFSVSTEADTEIVLIDEVLGVGDQSFITKAHDRLNKFIGHSGIVILANHSTELILELCHQTLALYKAVYLDHGELEAFGDAQSVMAQYHASV